MSKEHIYLGQSGEEAAVKFLKENGYIILVRNYKTKLGEIDIIAKDKDTFCFVEVKTRHSDRFGLPQEVVFKSKQRQIAKCALMFLKENNFLGKKARFDVVSIIYSNSKGTPGFNLIKDAFELDARFTY